MARESILWTGTYDNEHLPGPADKAKVDADFANFIRRLNRWCDKNGVKRPEWMAVARYAKPIEGTGEHSRHYHRVLFQKTEGLSLEAVNHLWRDKTGKRLGHIWCECQTADDEKFESLVRYVKSGMDASDRLRLSRNMKGGRKCLM